MRNFDNNNERWKTLKEIFSNALELKKDKQIKYLETACGDDPSLLHDLVSLLDAYDISGILDHSIDQLKVSALYHLKSRKMLGKKVGVYRIIEELGHGGMGTVYLAERTDDVFHQQVALKMMQAASRVEGQLLRFESERRIMASLNHDNIAHLYDGGITPDGQPWFVMEYVKGRPIDEHCYSRNSSLEKRLELLLEVCVAVQYAHANLIAHLDLKPGNILVTDEDKVKLLDFGIAKSLVSDENTTQTLPFTPTYASPEQMRSQTITASSDIYQLGVILYELLTGLRPYEVKGKTPGDMERTVCETKPKRPSRAIASRKKNKKTPGINLFESDIFGQFQKKLHGDLDTIVMKCLDKNPQHRYQSAGNLDKDIRGYLSGKPVSALPDPH